MIYNSSRPARALKAICGEQIFLRRVADGFEITTPRGVDWADYVSQPDLEIPQEGVDAEGNPLPPRLEAQPDLRVPRDPWLFYQQQYPALANTPQPSKEAVDSWEPPAPEPPAPEVETMTAIFIEARRQATLFLDTLKGQVWTFLKNEKNVEPATATANGIFFNSSRNGIGMEYDDFIKNGGHPIAAIALWERIQEIKENFSWLDADVEAIFAAALGQS